MCIDRLPLGMRLFVHARSTGIISGSFLHTGIVHYAIPLTSSYLGLSMYISHCICRHLSDKYMYVQ